MHNDVNKLYMIVTFFYSMVIYEPMIQMKAICQ